VAQAFRKIFDFLAAFCRRFANYWLRAIKLQTIVAPEPPSLSDKSFSDGDGPVNLGVGRLRRKIFYLAWRKND
jgi:hypothetical protein